MPRTKNSSVPSPCRCFWMLRDRRRDGLRALGGTAADHPTGLDGGWHRDARRCWPPLNRRADLGGPPDVSMSPKIIEALWRYIRAADRSICPEAEPQNCD